MANQESYDAAALFHVPKRASVDPQTGLDVTLYSWGRTELIQAVRNQGVNLHISRGRDAFDTPGVVDVLTPIVDKATPTTALHLGSRALSDYGVIRSITGSLAHVTEVPVLTHASIRKIASDKQATAKLLQGLGLHEGAYAISSSQDLSDALDAIQGDNVVLKPRRGARSEGVFVTYKQGAETAFVERTMKEDLEYILEEKLDFSTPFPALIRGYDDANQARLERANLEGANKELRAMYFGNGTYCYIGRAAQKDESDFRADDWVYLDQDTVPDIIRSIDESIIHELEQRTGIKEFHIAIDHTFATTDTDNEPRWRVMEINAGEPQLVRLEQHEVTAREHANLIAGQIARIARKRTLQ